MIIHLVFLHENGSRNNIGLNRNIDKIQFHPYFSTKDIIFIVISICFSLTISFYHPYILGDVVNNIPANAIQTPLHIQPEWYFLSSYAILRSLPRKTAGVLALVASVSIFFIIPIYKIKFSTKFSRNRYYIFWFILATFLLLIKLGAIPAEEPYINMGQVTSFIYFALILILNT